MKPYHWLEELKRRKVLRVATVYLLSTWLLVQIADATFEPIGLPPWTTRLVIVLAILGFPLVCVLAWVFDVTPTGVSRTSAELIDDEGQSQNQAPPSAVAGATMATQPVAGQTINNADAGVDTETYRFLEFELDLGAHQLRKNGQAVRLERRPMELLVLLVTRHGLLVPREKIIRHLWPGKVVIDFDTGLNTLVRKVRQALGDSADHPVCIETVAGVGYRFIASVTQPMPPASDVASSSATGTSAESRRRKRRVATAPMFALAIVVVIAFGAWNIINHEPPQISIAVLPFENLTNNDELSYLAAGLAEETSVSLAQIDLANLTVTGGVSARALANSTLPIKEIGRELGADYVVLSSLREEQSRIRVTSRLIRVVDDTQLWSATFDRALINVLGLQRELSIAIAEQIRLRLSPDVAAAIDRRQTQNPQAYALYLKGRYQWNQFSHVSFRLALQYYQQAVAIDPEYALAWAGIAHSLATSPMTADARPASVIPAAREALQQALKYGEKLAEVQYAQGYFYYFIDWNSAAAEESARRAVTLDPNSAISHLLLALAVEKRNDHVETRALMRRARELDPLFPFLFANSAGFALAANDPQAALEFARQAIAMNPELWVGYLQLGAALRALGDDNGALQAFSDAEKFSGGNSKTVAARALTLLRLGREPEAREILTALVAQSARRYVPPYNIALIYAGLGEIDLGFTYLENALVERDVHLMWLDMDRRFASMQTDPRFDLLLQRCACARPQFAL